MYRKEVNAQSPLRILEQSIHGGLGRGNLGVVMARAGVGKTACLVQIALDDLMRHRPVLHIALGQTLEHVQSWYDALFSDLAERTGLADAETVYAEVSRLRMINAFPERQLEAPRLAGAIETVKCHLGFTPAAILIDGYDWSKSGKSELSSLAALKTLASQAGAELWMSVQTHREVTGPQPRALPPPCDRFLETISVAIFLQPEGESVQLILLKDHQRINPLDAPLLLHPVTSRLVTDETALVPSARSQRSAYTVLSGGAKGAECEFGVCAEAWGLLEENYTFEGHQCQRQRGVISLGDNELAEGAVNLRYVEVRMRRDYPDTPLFKKMLQSIWHQVTTAGEVYVIGEITGEHTVRGGTGWAAQLARHWGKPLFVFDQTQERWVTWRDGGWQQHATPKIGAHRFTGCGTRNLNDAGRQAIKALFQNSFGDAE